MPSASWTVESDVLAAGDLRITVQRIALDQVREPGTLRSWGLAPLHRDGDEVLVPCAPGEALWIGAWMEESSSIGRARVTDPVSGHSGTLALPRDYQLALLRHEGSEPEPLALSAGATQRTLALELATDTVAAILTLSLLVPAAWAERSGREPPAPLGGPPPFPPRLG